MKRLIDTVFNLYSEEKFVFISLILIIILIMLVSGRALGQDPEKNFYRAEYIKVPPAINGSLDDDAWRVGLWCDDFTQNDPFNNKPVSQKTEFKILFDDDNLYIAIIAFDTNPDSIVRRLTRRDQIEGDVVAVIFDSYHDLRTGFFFGVSAAGVKYDLVYSNDGQSQDPSWDPNWWVKTALNDNSWVAEIKIPLNQIRFEKNSCEVWGLQVARLLYRKTEMDYWQHIPKDAPGFIHLFGELKGLEKSNPHKIFDITPYVLVKAETHDADKENPFRNTCKSYNLNGGMDSKIGITNNLTLDLTVNPDFGQVEADPSVVNLTAFETFYKEQRPFFIEGNNITDFNLGIGDNRIGNDNLFYSRRIGRAPQNYPAGMKDGWTVCMPVYTNILGAIKLTGKTKDGLSLGFIDAFTDEEKAEIDTVGGKIFRPVEPMTNYFVGRVQKDINSGNTLIGGIITSTNRMMNSTLVSVLHKSAYTGGLDLTQYFKKKSWMINLNSAISMVEGSGEALAKTQESSARYYQRPDIDYVKYDTQRKSLVGSGGRLYVMKLNGHFNFAGAVLWKSPGFETNDLGYIRQADQLMGILYSSYNQWEPKGIYRRYAVSSYIYSLYNFGGVHLATGIEPSANMTFRNYWNAYISAAVTTNQLSTTLLRGGPAMKIPGSYQVQYGFSSDNRRRLIISITSGISGQYLHNSGSRLINLGFQYKPTNYILISCTPQLSISDDHLQYIATLNTDNGPRYILATIHQSTISASLRANINISPNLSIQYWGQPFLAAGKYSDYKYVTDPTASSLNDRAHIYSDGQISGNGDGYQIDENEDGRSDYQIGTNDFNYQSFLSNLVIRWEYNPGSSLYLIWSQTRNGYDDSGTMDFTYLGSLFTTKPANIFLIKYSVRFGLK